MDVLLLNSPWTHPFHPGLALPSLTAHLTASGISAVQRDVSLEAFEYLLARSYLERCRDRAEGVLRSLPPGDGRVRLAECLVKGEMAVEALDSALRTLRSPDEYFDPLRLRPAQTALECAFDLICAAHPPLLWKATYWELPGVYQSSARVVEAARAEERNPFAAYYRESLAPSLSKVRPRVVGISVSLDQMSQLVPALALARVVREVLPGAHVTAGGIVFSKLQAYRDRFAPFFDVFDSIVLFEGETALLRLAEDLLRGREPDPARIPNLLVRRGGKVVSSPTRHTEDLPSLRVPSFQGLPLGRYLAPEPILPFGLGRGGCYYGRCSFCDSQAGHLGGHRSRGAARTAEDLARVGAATGATRFLCVDEAIPVPELRRFVGALEERGLGIRWTCWSRAARGLDARLLLRLARAGCRMVAYGVESGNDRVLRAMGKGTTRATVARVLADTRRAGIAATVNAILGYPSETRAEMEETIDFLFRTGGITARANLLPFFYKAATRVFEERERHPLRLLPDPAEDLPIFFRHEYGDGVSQDELNRLCEEVESALSRRYALQRLLGALGPHPAGFLYACRLGLEGLEALAGRVYAEPPGPKPAARPRLVPWVRVLRPRDGVAGALGQGAEGCAAVFDGLAGALRWIPGHVGRILELCDGSAPLEEVAGRVEASLLVGPLARELVDQTLRQLPARYLTWE